MSVANFLDV